MIKLILGDITKLNVDVIVNAANCELKGGAGVDGAIHKAAGSKLLKFNKLAYPNGIQFGDAIVSPPFDMNNVRCGLIQTVGPIYNPDRHDECCEILKLAYKNSLDIFYKSKAKSIAFPNISTGVYKFPIQLATDIAFDVIYKEMKNHDERAIIICCFTQENYDAWKKKLDSSKN